jgi:hypothetical protein
MVGQVKLILLAVVVEHDGLGTETACSYSGGGVPVITYSQTLQIQQTHFLYMVGQD